MRREPRLWWRFVEDARLGQGAACLGTGDVWVGLVLQTQAYTRAPCWGCFMDIP